MTYLYRMNSLYLELFFYHGKKITLFFQVIIKVFSDFIVHMNPILA